MIDLHQCEKFTGKEEFNTRVEPKTAASKEESIGTINTAEANLKEELSKQKALAEQAAKLASLGELAAGVGHEINNPLAIVKGFCRA
jgi:C4-dicarboxylate-specific signal transduction histidine kinase